MATNGRTSVSECSKLTNGSKNRLLPDDEPIHGWYRFVLGYPPHLVREYLRSFDACPERDWVLDPFSGTATTGVEARLQGFATISLDSNPISVLASRAKLTWDVDTDDARSKLADIIEVASACLRRANPGMSTRRTCQMSLFPVCPAQPITDRAERLAEDFVPKSLLPQESAELIPQGFISERPLMRVLCIRYAIEKCVQLQPLRDFMFLALASTIVSTAGNVAFGPEVYRTAPREDADVEGAFAATVLRMIADLESVIAEKGPALPPARVFLEDARTLNVLSSSPLIGAVITSPPYPNEKDYTRTTRLESVLLGLIRSRQDLRQLKSRLLRSNTRNTFVGDDEDTFVKDIRSVNAVAEAIEERRVRLGKTSGFERLYHRVTRLYFGGMYRHLAALLPRLRPGARCAYVVGDQMSYFRVHIRTAHLLADVAVKAGYVVEGIDLWRTRRSTVTGCDLEENVLILRRP